MSGPYGPPQGGQPGGSNPYGQGGPQPGQWPGGAPGYGQQQYGGPQGPGGYGGPARPGYGPGPGGYGPGPGGPGGQGGWQQGGPQKPPAPRTPVNLAKVLPLVVALLALLNLIFACFTGSKVTLNGNDESVGNLWYLGGWIPALLVVAGLLSLAPILPKAGRHPFTAAVLAVVGFLGAVFAWFSLPGTDDAQGIDYKAGIGLILVTIFALLEAAAAVAAWLADSGVVKGTVPVPATVANAVPPAFGGEGGHGDAGTPHRQVFGGPGDTGGYQSPQPTVGTEGQGQPTGYQQQGDQPYYGGYGQGGATTGATPTVGSGESGTDPNRRDDGPDATQQVRF
ncbi:DUF5336 domain-containing protein [Nakamurella endophytica]|uniref:Uncharacterized protein n=1 Tax=Nakamurella endophytica TaxID=1748367 RepID=A0A917SYF6_9ACTN|nr:DUF5336 domain-containing protein [Nakamurella endophytica]GGM02591.1 hypothetical protein GCM10011594_23380 [Nakamurella endophytica]